MRKSKTISNPVTTDHFTLAKDKFEALSSQLSKSGQEPCNHAVIEEQILNTGTELMRLLFQGYLDLKSYEEVTDDQWKTLESKQFRRVRLGCNRVLTTRFGQVKLKRRGYFFTDQQSIYPLDAKLNLSHDSYSYGLHRLAAKFSSDLSFDKTLAFIKDTCGSTMPKRQIEESVSSTAECFDRFYSGAQAANDRNTTQHLVLTADAKGVVMRQESLRDQTRKKAEKSRRHKRIKSIDWGKVKKIIVNEWLRSFQYMI